MILSLVTGTLNRPASFQRLLRSIQDNTSVPWELVVSDASDVSYVPTDDNIVVLPERPRLGCTRAYNRAFRAAKGEWVIWLNDDAEVLPGYAETAIRFMETHPQIGLGALHYSEDGSPFHINSAWGVPYANFGILRRELGNQFGFFDESLIMYGCDNSITFRVLLAGYGVSDIPGTRIIHHSEKDHLRTENQQHRRHDNQVLTKAYMPLRQYWLKTYRKHAVNTGTQPWSHGVSPERVAVMR